MNRLGEILQRKKDIRALLEDTEQRNLDLDALEKELGEWEKEETEIRRRMEILEKVPQGTKEVEKPKQEEREAVDIYDSVEYRNAFMHYVIKGTPIPQEYRANQNTLTTDIGAVIPPTTMNKIIQKMESAGMVLPLVTNTNFKPGMSIPLSNVVPVATWVNEGQGSDRQKQAPVGNVVFGHFKLQCRVSTSLETSVMALSAFESMLTANIAKAMVKAVEMAIINGTGTGQPTGILKEATEGVKIDVKEFDYATLVKAEGELPEEYEQGTIWVMSKKTFMDIHGMVDKNGQPIARTNFGIGGKAERTILGRTVLLVPYLKNFNVAQDGDIVAFMFRFEDYVLNTNYQVGIKTYEDNETDDIVRKSTMICDGRPTQYHSLVKLAKKG